MIARLISPMLQRLCTKVRLICEIDSRSLSPTVSNGFKDIGFPTDKDRRIRVIRVVSISETLANPSRATAIPDRAFVCSIPSFGTFALVLRDP